MFVCFLSPAGGGSFYFQTLSKKGIKILKATGECLILSMILSMEFFLCTRPTPFFFEIGTEVRIWLDRLPGTPVLAKHVCRVKFSVNEGKWDTSYHYIRGSSLHHRG